MANPKIKFKRSAVEGKRPDNSSLELGEIAVNTYDGRIYLKRDTSGADIDGIKLVNPWIENNANTGIACTYPVNISGLTTFTQNVHLLDSDKLLFGAGEDLEIYHDGSHSYISDQGQGNLKVLSNNIRFTNPDESKVSATFVASGDVDLYYDNNLRFSTTGVGVTIWGETETRTLNVSGVSTFGSNIISSGIITATQFIGDGSGLSNIVGTGTGVYIQVNDTQIGAASTLAFSGNLSATVSAGIATISVPTTSLVRQSFTATANQTSFTVSGGYTDGYIDIHLNGVKLNVGTDVTANDESTIVLSVGASAGDVIETTVFKTLQISPDTNIRKQIVNITDNTPSINVTSGYNVGHLDVYLNGLKLIDGTDFTATNGTSVSLTRAAVDGDTVEFVAVRTLNSIPGAGIGTDGSVNTVGIITAASFHGDGSNVTGISTSNITNYGVGFVTFTNNNQLTNGAGYITTSFTNTNQLTNGAGFITASDDITGNAATATALETARTISGTSFDGTSNITLNNSNITNGAGYITTSFTNTNQLTNGAGYITTSFTNTNQLTNGAGFITASDDITGNAASATTLETARNIAGVSFDGSQNISLNNNAITNGAGYITTSFTNTNQLTNGAGYITTSFTNTNQLTNGAGFITNSVTGNFSVNGDVSIGGTLTYEDVANIDSVGMITARRGIVSSGIVTATGFVGDLTGDVTGTASNATQLNSQAASYYLDYDNFNNTPTIPTNNNQLTNGAGFITTSFTNTNQLTNGAGFITTSFTNTNQLTNGAGFITASDDITGNAATATALENARTIAGVSFDGSQDISLNNNAITNGAGYITTSFTNTNQLTNGAGFITNNVTGIVTATGFVGDLTGDVTGNADTATSLAGNRTISGVSFNGTSNITLNNSGITNGAGYITTSFTNTNQLTNGAGFITTSVTGNFTVSGDATINDLTIGTGAGDVSTNTVIGYDALKSNTTGFKNIAVGYGALKFNTEGVNNLAVGHEVLNRNTDGGSNAGFGFQALNKNTEGNNNLAVGYQALRQNTTGGTNIAIGKQCMENNLTAIFNTAIGYQALRKNTTGNRNLAVGYQSLVENIDGLDNIAIGFKALGINTTGNDNVALGYESGYYIEGNNNTILGGYKGVASDSSLSDTVIIAAGTAERLRIDSTGNLGIGLTNPSTKLEVNGNITATGFVGDLTGDVTGNSTGLSGAPSITVTDLTATGTVSIAGTLSYEDVTSVDSLGIGTFRSGVKVTTGGIEVSNGGADITGNIIVTGTVDGRDVATDGSKLDGISAGAEVNVNADWNSSSGDSEILNKPTIPTNNNQLTNGAGYITSADGGNAATLDSLDSTQFLRSDASDIKTSGDLRFNDNILLNFGTGDDAELFFDGAQLYLDLNAGSFYIRDNSTIRYSFEDDGHFTATGNITAYSDITLKKNIEVIPNALDKVLQLRGVTFDRKDIETSRQLGVIAQEVEKVCPEVVSTNDDDIKSVAYGNMVGLLIEAVKEQQVQINKLQEKIDLLERN